MGGEVEEQERDEVQKEGLGRESKRGRVRGMPGTKSRAKGLTQEKGEPGGLAMAGSSLNLFEGQ